eukprot:2083959-Pleurochrysis_carterae.AAC.1
MLLLALERGAHTEDKTNDVRRLTRPEKTEVEERERWERNRKEVSHFSDKQHTYIHAEGQCRVLTSPGGRSTRLYEEVTRRTAKGHQQTKRGELVEDGHNGRLGEGSSNNQRVSGLVAKQGREIPEPEGSDKFRAGLGQRERAG